MHILDRLGPSPGPTLDGQSVHDALSIAENRSADTLCMSGQYKEALAYLDRAIKASPTNALLYANRSVIHLAIASSPAFRSAVNDAKRATELAPHWPRAWYRYGIALRSLRKFRSAYQAFQRAIDIARAGLGRRPTVAAPMASEEPYSHSVTSSQEGLEHARERSAYLDPVDAATGLIAEISIALEETVKLADGEGGTCTLPSDTKAGKHGAAAQGEADRLVDLPEDALEGDESAEGDVFQQLESWLSEGSSFPFLYMRRYGPGARGVHARVDTAAETELLAIGHEYLITVEMGRASPIGRKIAQAGIERDLSAAKHCYLTLYVLWDRKNEASFFQPYYRILPSAYPNMPLFWSETELLYLRGSYVVQQIRDRKANIRADYELICTHAPEMRSLCTLEEFCWGRMMVASRNFGIVVDGIRTDALVPYADMLNHYRPRQTRWAFDNRKRCFVITSLQRLHAGQQVYDSYGKKCNSRFLLNYGFAVDNNVDEDIGQNHNEVRLALCMPGVEDDPLQGRRLEVACGVQLEQFQAEIEEATQAPGSAAAEAPLPVVGYTAARPSTASAIVESKASPKRSSSLDGTSGPSSSPSAGYSRSGPQSASINGSLSRSMAALDMAERPVARHAGYVSGNIPGREFNGAHVSRGSIVGRAVRVSTYYESEGTVEAFSWLRLLHATPMELAAIPKLEDDHDLIRRPIRPLSASNEAAVLSHLARACEAQLDAYPTTLGEDVEEIASGKYPYYSNRRNALILLRGEKEICAYFIKLCKEALPYLTGPFSKLSHLDARSRVMRLYGTASDLDKYMRNVVLALLKRQEEGLGPGGPVGPSGIAPPPVPIPMRTRAQVVPQASSGTTGTTF